MTFQKHIATAEVTAFAQEYLSALSLIEHLHRLLLDLLKDEFERSGIDDINAVQALLLFNVGNQEVTAGELRSRGFYQGSNVSYNLKKLVEQGYMHHKRCDMDGRAVRVSVTDKGRDIARRVGNLFERHGRGLQDGSYLDFDTISMVNLGLRRVEKYWADQIRYIY
ncbi:helix-turn-helix domain-containing protein [Palleronia caenipelagi]|uniref:MarR family transcriptional regulator n=1 Tax=Palleronia caenipelagi TaxID=2489174 RepID=A0A547Q9L8_9RHOB|nr:MarR family transcriptional regulator [Palleronia caenipelagi]TRD23064.1 MarR family transcriptional regulator [Palleronia caenipelagi]